VERSSLFLVVQAAAASMSSTSLLSCLETPTPGDVEEAVAEVVALAKTATTVTHRTSSMLRQLRLLEASTASLAILAPMAVTAVTLRRQVLLLLSTTVVRAAMERAMALQEEEAAEALVVLLCQVISAQMVHVHQMHHMVEVRQPYPVADQEVVAVVHIMRRTLDSNLLSALAGEVEGPAETVAVAELVARATVARWS